MKTQVVKRKDGSVITVYRNEKGEYICEGYDAENDITKPHDQIVCKVAEIDLELEELLRQTNLQE
jgi:hypothetical protein